MMKYLLLDLIRYWCTWPFFIVLGLALLLLASFMY